MSHEATLVNRLRDRIYNECDAAAILATGDVQAQQTIRSLAKSFLVEERRVLAQERVVQIVEQVVAATTGLGPLQPLLEDPSISEIMVNGPHCVFVERGGTLEKTELAFLDEEHVRQVIDRILAPLGRRLDALNPMVDARLPDGSRVNAVIPPLSLEGPLLTIRRFVPVASSLDDLVSLGSCDSCQTDELRELVASRANVLVAGGTGSGKTTLLAAALQTCDARERIVVIEDAAELPLEHPHRLRLESRPATFEGEGAVRIRDLVRNALRMRPDRIIVGEVRGDEAFDLLQALNTGHRGCWSTVHANSPEDALYRLESMAMYADTGVPQPVIRTLVARALDAVVFVGRVEGGSRRLEAITRVGVTATGWHLK